MVHEFRYVVDDEDHVIAAIEQQYIHRPPYPIHRSVSMITLDHHNNLILQRRARWKNVYPGALDIHGGNVDYPYPQTNSNVMPDTQLETPIERRKIYLNTAYREFNEEVGLEIAPQQFGWIIPHPLDFFKLRMDDNRENKVIFLIRLQPEHWQKLQAKNKILESLWAGIYDCLATKQDLSVEELKQQSILPDQKLLRKAILDELKLRIREENSVCYEVEEYVCISLDEALQQYYQQRDIFADGFFSLFDASRNHTPEATFYEQIIPLAMLGQWE